MSGQILTSAGKRLLTAAGKRMLRGASACACACGPAHGTSCADCADLSPSCITCTPRIFRLTFSGIVATCYNDPAAHAGRKITSSMDVTVDATPMTGAGNSCRWLGFFTATDTVWATFNTTCSGAPAGSSAGSTPVFCEFSDTPGNMRVYILGTNGYTPFAGEFATGGNYFNVWTIGNTGMSLGGVPTVANGGTGGTCTIVACPL